ncbi:MAG: ThiF family adenylyltransferase [Anaerolineaceae bacterium]|jgi:molybdopterin/thiamine biosynthesis adenylyltransferase
MLRYQRNHDAISEVEQAILAEKRVLVVGCGGLGGYVIECLARVGVGHLRVVDGDVFEESNLNRQLLSSTMNLGRPKTLAAQQRIMAVNPMVEVQAIPTLLTVDNAEELLSGCDVAVDALDNIPDRLLLQQAAKSAGIPMVHAAVTSWLGRVCVIKPGEDLLNILYPIETRNTGEEGLTSILATSVAATAAFQAAETIKLLLSRPGLQGETLELDLLNMTVTKIKLI